MKPNKLLTNLDNNLSFKIENAWVENMWKYECVDDRAVLTKDDLLQLVIEADYGGVIDNSDYWLMEMDYSTGCALRKNSILEFNYNGQDSIRLTVVKRKPLTAKKDQIVIDTIIFNKLY